MPNAIPLFRVSIYQVFMMLGVERTSPAIASAMPNLGPGFIFVIAACLRYRVTDSIAETQESESVKKLYACTLLLIVNLYRFERFNWKCKYTRAKILGTLVCLSGAMCVSFLKNSTPSVSPKSIPGDEELSSGKSRKEWVLGCFYLLTGVTIFACNTVMQVLKFHTVLLTFGISAI